MMMIVFQVLKDKDDGLDGDLDIRDAIYIVQSMMILTRRILLMISMIAGNVISRCYRAHIFILTGRTPSEMSKFNLNSI